MSHIPSFLLQHEVTVAAYLGDSAYGPRYADPVTIRCFLEEGNRLVRSKEGTEVVSSARFFCRLDAVTAPPESQVTLPDSRVTTVISASRRDGGGLASPDHLEVSLQ